MTTWELIREAIRRGRLDRRMTVRELAKKVGLSTKQVTQMEHPDTHPNYDPQILTVIAIVEVGFELKLCSFVCWAMGEAPVDVGLPAMPPSMIRAAALAKTRPKRQPSETKPAIHRIGAKDRRLTRPR
jgi:transcriptional regulator with XRE-family HTH domain